MGIAIKESGVPRESLFVTTKIPWEVKKYSCAACIMKYQLHSIFCPCQRKFCLEANLNERFVISLQIWCVIDVENQSKTRSPWLNTIWISWCCPKLTWFSFILQITHRRQFFIYHFEFMLVLWNVANYICDYSCNSSADISTTWLGKSQWYLLLLYYDIKCTLFLCIFASHLSCVSKFYNHIPYR